MKNKNIKNNPKKCGRWPFLHSRFSKIFRGRTPRTPLIKGIHQLNPQNISSPTTAAKGKKKKKKKKPESPPPLKQSTINLSLGYTEIEKGGGRWGKIFFVWFVIGLFETLICAIAEDKVCNRCIVSSWALLIFLLCLWWPNFTTSHFLTTRPAVGCCLGKKVSTLIDYLLMDGLNCQIFSRFGIWNKGLQF